MLSVVKMEFEDIGGKSARPNWSWSAINIKLLDAESDHRLAVTISGLVPTSPETTFGEMQTEATRSAISALETALADLRSLGVSGMLAQQAERDEREAEELSKPFEMPAFDYSDLGLPKV